LDEFLRFYVAFHEWIILDILLHKVNNYKRYWTLYCFFFKSRLVLGNRKKNPGFNAQNAQKDDHPGSNVIWLFTNPKENNKKENEV